MWDGNEMRKGFNSERYIKLQSEAIKNRLDIFDKLYLEVGGKLFSDTHAKRVLPGFEDDVKIKVLESFKDDLEMIFTIRADHIDKNKTRAEYGITYSAEILNVINEATNLGFKINSVVITLYEDQKSVDFFINKLKQRKIKTYVHRKTKGYPSNVDLIVSKDGYGKNSYIKTTKKVVVVTSPGASSGKLATCLSQLYHDNRRKIKSGYAKYETFPVWNLPVNHPVNLAYEAATANINDILMIDPFHLEKYKENAVNYNRDVETFPIVKNILHKIYKEDIYYSPTDVSINMIRESITNINSVSLAAKKEIVRRYYEQKVNLRLGFENNEAIDKINLILSELNIDKYFLDTVKPTKEIFNKEKRHVISLKYKNKMISGKETELLSPASSLIINAIKELTNLPDDMNLLAPNILIPIFNLKKEKEKLLVNEVLIALSISAVTNPIIERALNKLPLLENTDAHSSYIVRDSDLHSLKNLGINLTCEDVFFSDNVL